MHVSYDSYSTPRRASKVQVRSAFVDFSRPKIVEHEKRKSLSSKASSKRLVIISPEKNLAAATSVPEHPLKQVFDTLALQWRNAVMNVSSPTEMAMHPAYQRIIGMGPDAVPLIIAEMKKSPDWWFWALRALTGDDPVPEASRGRLAQMTQAWLEWWEKKEK